MKTTFKIKQETTKIHTLNPETRRNAQYNTGAEETLGRIEKQHQNHNQKSI